MSVPSNDAFVEVGLKEVSKDDQFYDVLEAVANHLQISLVNPGAVAGIAIYREGFQDAVVASYVIREKGDGTTLGLFKNVDGAYRPISLPLPGEIQLIKGPGNVEITVPLGWQLEDDPEIVAKFNLGTSPNWKVAAVRYVGI